MSGYVFGGGTSGGGGAVTSVAGKTGVVTLTAGDVTGDAPLASPTFTGTPVAPTAAQGTNTTQVATTAMVHSEAVLLATIASPTFTGTPTLPTGTIATTQAAADSSTKVATTAFVAATAGAVGGFPKIVRRSSDAAGRNSGNTGTTLTADDTLLWAVGASDVWFLEAFLIFSAANTAMDLKVGWTVPASGTMSWGALGSLASTVAGFGATGTASTPLALKAAGGSLTGGTDAITMGYSVGGVYVGGGTSGNVTLTWAQNTSDAASLALLTNSILRLQRLA